MKYTYLELNNYIGIYNGMGLYQIQIDFTKATHRICVIKGTNGSGKTTIQNALSLFPDGTESFIPDKSASKIIRILNKGIEYEIKFYHDIRPNGTRNTTKAFISKMDENGNMIEMNENGNVTSYKDILVQEFNLDTNFLALTKLSMDDRGIGYKKPADRKKFVNSIIESLEVYNDIYKTISKKANNLKAIMNNITSKMGSLGDKEALEKSKEYIEKQIDLLNKQRDEANSRIAEIKANITMLDPDNTIQHTYHSTENMLKKINNSIRAELDSYKSDNYIFIPEVEIKVLNELLERVRSAEADFERRISDLKSSAKYLIEQMNTTQNQITSIDSELGSLKSDEYVYIENEISKLTKEANEIASMISVTGIDPMAFTKDEYITALETVHDIVNMVNVFRSTYDYNMITTCISEYANLGYVGMPSMLRCDDDIKFISSAPEIQRSLLQKIADAESDLKLVNKLNDRPVECKIDSCYYIADAVKAAATNPESRLKDLNQQYEQFKSDLDKAYRNKEYTEIHNSCINQIRTIIRAIDNNNGILIKLPNGGIFNSKAEFFESLVGGQSFEYIDRIYQYINVANYFEQYQNLYGIIKEYQIRLDSMSSSINSMKKLEAVKKDLIDTMNLLETRLNANKKIIKHTEISLENVRANIRYIDTKIAKCNQITDMINQANSYKEQIEKIYKQMEDINQYVDKQTEAVGYLKVTEANIEYKRKERDQLLYKINQIYEYEQSLKEYTSIYDYYNEIKYYSSPTTGIQLVFMQLYMGKILSLSNQLLSYLFGGQYQLQPFIINEDEFRIPCMGNGYLNDDISSMSSSQLTMISMILSFSLLAASSTEYNIIKLDEIDDPLDEPNRAAFALLLDNIMDIMHTEQCIMISHSSEMITSNSDIILLRSDGLVSVDPSSNIIWRYE